MIYFIRMKSGEGPIKIGLSKNPTARLSDMQRSSPYELEIIAAIAGGLDMERRFHSKFQEANIRHEWFEPTRELLATIGAINSGAFNVRDLPKTGKRAWVIRRHKMKAELSQVVA